jgi:NAD(P)H-hydrate epimerase
MGALRAGAGLVTVATPERMLPVIASHVPEMMTEPLAGTDADCLSMRGLDYGRLTEISKGKNVLAMGPGLGTQSETQQFVRTVLRDTLLPTILDADGLNAFAGRANELRERAAPLAVTPHPGEMARLLGCTTAQVQADRLMTALNAAKEWNAFVVLKGHCTIVATPDGRAFINSTGNPGMATGGTGDVLTGMLAGLTAQFASAPWEQVLGLGVYLHGLAGDFAAEQFGEQSLIATDLVAAIPRAWREVRSSLGHG